MSGDEPAKLLTMSKATRSMSAGVTLPTKTVLTAQTKVGDISHSMFDSPDDRVDDQLELRRWELEKRYTGSALAAHVHERGTDLGSTLR